jgi:hypothetical protein
VAEFFKTIYKYKSKDKNPEKMVHLFSFLRFNILGTIISATGKIKPFFRLEGSKPRKL